MLDHLILVLARAVQTVDARLPTAVNKRTGVSFGAGLGPHSESETFKLIVDEARAMEPNWFTGAVFVMLSFGLPLSPFSRRSLPSTNRSAAGVVSFKSHFCRGLSGYGTPTRTFRSSLPSELSRR